MSGDDASETSLEARTQAFLAEFFNRGQQLVRDLIEENEALRTRLASRGDDPASEVIERLRKQVADLEAECERMRLLAGEGAQASGGYRERLESLEVEHYHLAARQVSAEQLRRSTSLEEVVRSTTEILLNLVGVGRFAIHGVDHERSILFPLWVEGRADEGDEPVDEVPLSASTPCTAVATATEPWRPPAGLALDLSSPLCVPLVGDERTLGVLEMVRFLPQKHEFNEHDLALLELISSESGSAVDAAWTRAHAPDVPFSRGGVEELLG